MSQAMDKQAFLTLILNQFIENPEQKGEFVKRLLAGLHVNDPILESDESTHQEGGVTIPSDVIKRILTGIDSGLEASTTTGEDMFFDSINRGLYTSVKDALREVFEASNKDEAYQIINEINALKEEAFKRINTYVESLSDTDGE